MHNLALALRAKGFEVTGSDDEIFEPSKTRLANAGILPSAVGWFPEKIGSNLDAVILGMHARNDNPELVKARELGLKIFSYPEYLYEQTRDKVRAVVGGSHGKTTITSMVMHVLKASGKKFDYMVGSQVEGFDTMVGLSNEAPVAIFEGDEYLTSPIDLRPKFHLYNASIGLISGIAWDHVNVFPTFDGYVEQFRIFAENIEPSGTLIYCEDDKVVCEMVESSNIRAKKVGYKSHPHHKQGEKWVLETSYGAVVVMVFGNHNMQNIAGAKEICTRLGVSEMEFYDAILSFGGAAKRLQLLGADKLVTYYLDFAHSPSKVQATVEAVKEQFPHHNLVAALELHTFSSLSASFLSHYKGTMEEADKAVVFFNPEAILHKNLPTLTTADVKNSFGRDDLTVFSDSQKLKAAIFRQYSSKTVVLLMSSGNFGGLDLPDLVSKALEK